MGERTGRQEERKRREREMGDGERIRRIEGRGREGVYMWRESERWEQDIGRDEFKGEG